MKRRRVGAGTAAVALALGMGLGACAQGNTPDEYNTLTRQNFLETCTNFYFNNTDDSLSITENTVQADVEAPDQSVCQCRYEVFAGPNGDGTDGGMPINEDAAEAIGWTGPNFTDLNADLKSNPQEAWDALPAEFKDGLTDCDEGGGSTTTTTAGDGSTTTTAAGSTTDETDADENSTTTAG